MLGLGIAALSPPALAGTQDQARVALHLKTHTVKATTTCTTWSPNAQGLPCSKYVTSGAIGQNYDAYLVVGHGNSDAGIAGVSCRVMYDNAAGRGVDVFHWTLCGDQEVVGEGGFGEWPASGGTNSITWNAGTNCQRTEIGGEGVHAVAGAFYVYAYSVDFLEISPVESGFTLTDCQGAQTHIYHAPPSVGFGPAAGYVTGENPCRSPCLDVDTSPITFGGTFVGSTRDSTIMIRNNGHFAVSGTWSVSGAAFSLVSPVGPFAIGAGTTTPVTVRFTPTVHGASTGTLNTGAPCWRTATLSGTGLSTCVFAPSSVNFGSLAISETETRSVMLTNTHVTPLIGTIVVTGNDFQLGAVSSALALAPGDSTAIPVVFSPLHTGPLGGLLSVGGTCPGATLSGVGMVTCAIAPTTGSFGIVPVGGAGEINFTLTNNRRSALSGQVVSQVPPFSIVSGATPFVLPPGGTHPFRVRFAPTTLGSFTGTVSFGSPCASLSVTGEARAASARCRVLPSSELNFGVAQLGVGRTEVIRFVDFGEDSFLLRLDEESMQPHFSLPNGEGPFAVAPGDTLDVPVLYNPLTTGVHVATLVANAPCSSVRLVGFGQRSPVACVVTASELDFGDVPVGGSREMEFLLFNYAPEPAFGYAAAKCDDFEIAGDTFYQIAWADSHSVRVRFTPRVLGAQTCEVAVGGSCGDTISIAGYGIAPPDTARAHPWIFAATRPNEGVQRLVYDILAAAHVEIIVFDVVGHELARFDEGIRPPGRFEVSWDARQRAGGIYFARIEAARASFTQRVLLLR